LTARLRCPTLQRRGENALRDALTLVDELQQSMAALN
jgi:hypothetical protein